jgi:hypothetical protein
MMGIGLPDEANTHPMILTHPHHEGAVCFATESGTLYHAAHGLRIYYEPVFGDGLSPQILVLPPEETRQSYTSAHP